jgi:serine protease AprX
VRKVRIFATLLVALLIVGGPHPSVSAQLLPLPVLTPPPQPPAPSPSWALKVDPLVLERASLFTGRSKVVVTAINASSLPVLRTLLQLVGGTLGRSLPIIVGQAVEVPNLTLPIVAGSSLVKHVSLDRSTFASMEPTGATVGATTVRQELGLDGSGIGVAVIDSGVTPSHDDLIDPNGAQRVVRFVDFINGRPSAYDDYGHGSHVAGIIAGNGFDSGGARSGIAPGSDLMVLKVLDGAGKGRISDVIAALNYVLDNKDAHNIRVVNLSIGAGVFESYNADPLTLAAQRLVSAGIVVVAAAGNLGLNQQGQSQYGGVAAPGNAPWVLTVGASNHAGTEAHGDDTIAPFSSRGPAAVDRPAKPDVVAPGVRIESLSDPLSAFYRTFPQHLRSGTVVKSYLPYLSLNGTSMASPVVAGTVALMLQANPALTPNAVKAIVQYTAEVLPGYDALTEGAGLLNARGSVALARSFAGISSPPDPNQSAWSGQIIWGNQMIGGGVLTPDANAWSMNVVWGAGTVPGGANIVWGDICTAAPCSTPSGQGWSSWQTTCADAQCATFTWGSGSSSNVVWGSECGGADCGTSESWAPSNPAEGTSDTSVVWGSADGTSGGTSVVWGSTSSHQ